MATQNEIIDEIVDAIDPRAIDRFGIKSIRDLVEDYVINLKAPASIENVSEYAGEIQDIIDEGDCYEYDLY
jgi:hypothetical protein